MEFIDSYLLELYCTLVVKLVGLASVGTLLNCVSKR